MVRQEHIRYSKEIAMSWEQIVGQVLQWVGYAITHWF